jgi:hypothetical protein
MAVGSPDTTAAAACREIGVLVVDHHPALRTALRELVDDEPGFHCIAPLSHAEGFPAAASARLFNEDLPIARCSSAARRCRTSQ